MERVEARPPARKGSDWKLPEPVPAEPPSEAWGCLWAGDVVLRSDAAALLVETADAMAIDWRRAPARLTDGDVLEGALRAMRGNRSSSTVTWFDATGTLRVLERPATLIDDARAPGVGAKTS